jgi:hypothetical protein
MTHQSVAEHMPDDLRECIDQCSKCHPSPEQAGMSDLEQPPVAKARRLPLNWRRRSRSPSRLGYLANVGLAYSALPTPIRSSAFER